MPTSVITCADVEARDLEAGYLAGRLSPDEAAAYEAHYFGCERCWPSLKRATELRGAFAKAAPPARFRLNPGLAAAALLVIALGGWLLSSQLNRGGVDTTRGAADSLVLRSSSSPAGLQASWPAVSGADRYRVRLFAADGGLLLERETADTMLAVPGDSVPRHTGSMFWQVQALDALRQQLARSALTPAGSAAGP